MVWYAKIPDNIQRVMSYWKTFLAYFRSPSILNVLQVETAMPGFLHTHYGAIRKSSCANIRLSCHTAFLYVVPFETFLHLYCLSPSFSHLSFIPISANSVCRLWCALISGWEIWRFGAQLSDCQLQLAGVRNKQSLNKPQNQFRACVHPHIGKHVSCYDEENKPGKHALHEHLLWSSFGCPGYW